MSRFHINNKEWKCFDASKFYYKNFNHVENANSFFGLDFFYKEIYFWGVESPTNCCYENFDCVINEGDVVVDLGANIGLFSVRAAQTASKVIAVEASTEAFSCLVENTRDFENVECLNSVVVGDNDDNTDKLLSESPFIYSKKMNYLNLTLEKIMEICKLDRIDFLKIDIEGFEYDVLGSLSIENLAKIDKIACETHDSEKDKYFELYGKNKKTWVWFFDNGNSSENFSYFLTNK